MSSSATFTCVCGVQKKTSNHWILAVPMPETIKFLPWDWAMAVSEDVVVLCGERCASALLSRVMGGWRRRSMEGAGPQLAA